VFDIRSTSTTDVVETGVAGTDAAVEEGVETGGAAAIVLVAVAAEAEVCFRFDLQMIISIFPLCIMSNPILFSSTSSIGRRSFSTTDMTLLSEKPVATTTTTSDDVDEYQYVMIDEKPQEANDRAIDDEEEDSGDDEDYDSWDEDEEEMIHLTLLIPRSGR